MALITAFMKRCTCGWSGFVKDKKCGEYIELTNTFFNKFIVTEERYQAYPEREKQCRHIIRVGVGDGFQRLYCKWLARVPERDARFIS